MTTLDLFGIGTGPFNLSLAALADSIPQLRCRFAERRPQFAWHPGIMIAGTTMQTSFLKDLVTPVLPTSCWSFVNYLVEHERFFLILWLHAEVAQAGQISPSIWVGSHMDWTIHPSAIPSRP
ncbi:MAG: SidA/IucD/PvdA family monooxygenase [Paracoccus sp. (in: a-proteobacteria)]